MVSLAGAILLLASIPAKWEEFYAIGLGISNEMSVHSGWFIGIGVALIVILILTELRPGADRPLGQGAVVCVLCATSLVYALYTWFGTLAVGVDNTGPISSGVRAGPGIWLAVLGSIVCAAGQGILLMESEPLIPPSTQEARR